MSPDNSSAHAWSVEFFTDAAKRNPVALYLDSLPVRERVRIARYLQLLHEFGPALTMPQSRHIEGRLWELRPEAHRILYVILAGRRCVLLHAFRKQTQQTPRREIERAIRRLNELLSREHQEDA